MRAICRVLLFSLCIAATAKAQNFGTKGRTGGERGVHRQISTTRSPSTNPSSTVEYLEEETEDPNASNTDISISTLGDYDNPQTDPTKATSEYYDAEVSG